MHPALAAVVLVASLFVATVSGPVAAAEGAKAQPPAAAKQKAAGKNVKKKFRILLHVSDHDPKQWEQALQNAEAMRRKLGAQVDIEILANGYGLAMLKADNEKFAPLINATLDRSVDVVACGETMERTGVKKEDLVGGVRVVPGGIPEIAMKTQAGWTYIKP